MTAPLFSIIIPAHNEADFIGQTLDAAHHACEALRLPYEIIVANDASTDPTAQVARDHGSTVTNVNLRQIAAVRNAGAALARGKYLVFLDADTILPPQTLDAAHRALRQGAIAGGARVRMDAKLPFTMQFGLNFWNTYSRLLNVAAGCFIFCTRHAFDQTGGFDTTYFASEEIHFSNALKRFGPFNILAQHVITSARKTDPKYASDYWGTLFRTVFSFGNSLKKREGLNLWYPPEGTNHSKSE